MTEVKNFAKNYVIKRIQGTTLMAWWVRICLPMQQTWVQTLVQEDSTCLGATEPVL